MSILPVIQKQMVEEFQCPGCACGLDTTGTCFKADPHSLACIEHHAGTMIPGIGSINLGLPKGFNRLGMDKNRDGHGSNNIRLYEKFEDHPGYNHLNIPVWAREISENDMDVLVVRCYCPRVNWDFVDVILNGKLDDVRKNHPQVYDVSEFIESIN
ncbi:MAG: hypothetical protein OPY06_00005 [Nitrosopumilus sp.]|nr:hypothetical protein [Nitrosopumilus sp.]